jgi:RNA polymerase subunit RPABC4/transcription elongation factor Spt4
MKRKICKQCKLFYTEAQCPNCKSEQLANGFKGRLHILDSKNSHIAKELEINHDGEYAIKLG